VNRQVAATFVHRDDRKAMTWQFSRIGVTNFLRSVYLSLKIVEILQNDAEKFSVRSEAPTDKARR
jgi:hypothetical protein